MKKQKKKWKVYIVAHNKIFDEMMSGDKRFNNDNYCFLNVGPLGQLKNSDKYCCVDQKKLPGYVALGKEWAESEGIYNIWRSGAYKELDFIGFVHYDKEFRLTKKYMIGRRTNITQRINRYLKYKNRAHISLETHNMQEDYGQKIMADVTRPNELTGDGVNCYQYILEDYNNFFNTNYTIENILEKKCINLCSCFLIDVQTFDRMLKFFDWIVQSHKLEVFDTEHKHRFQGGIAERYFGVFLLLEYDKMLDLSLVHRYNDGLK